MNFLVTQQIVDSIPKGYGLTSVGFQNDERSVGDRIEEGSVYESESVVQLHRTATELIRVSNNAVQRVYVPFEV